MRTTLTLEDELAARIEELRRSRGLSFKGAINELLRAGLQSQMKPQGAKRYRSRPRRLGLRAGIDPVHLNRLSDELESGAFTDRTRRS